ncbi:FMN-binding protein [Geosporobacter ferrireducens]|uniref:FMN-binding domain-containing protein n=1 Tax=Geosporobacter ferrireducens TaxID=1424294 RepID=A0A1D8GCF8_9FIRM|nr:FMN-binding protein [Geosporobacter ferrireducens]AOT68588.1 hypothetical protein Gferi_02640 [Geosporobacter ferrireducens]MTI54057.1 FMN-binding protein [Geosporobacter ferrireducens]
MKKGSLYAIIFMILITSTFTFALAALNESTAGLIEGNQFLKQQKAILYVFNIPIHNGMSAEEISNLYKEHIRETTLGNYNVYEAFQNDNLLGYAFPLDGSGLWGSIRGIIAMTPELDTILGIDFLAHSETPGLGGRIDELWFKEQFRNISLGKTYPFVFYRPAQEGVVDSISGATATSKAVLDIINEDVNTIKETAKGGI